MTKTIQLFIIYSLSCSSLYASDVNVTLEIINRATNATKELAVELEPIVNGNEVEGNVTETSDINLSSVKSEEREVSVDKGNPRKGKNIFKYVLKEDCNMTGYQFAEKYSQEDWIEILEEKRVKEVLFKSCPKVESYYQERWTDDLYQFFYEASSEDEIPEC